MKRAGRRRPPVLSVRSLCPEVRLRPLGRGRGLERSVDVRRRGVGVYLGRHAGQRRPHLAVAARVGNSDAHRPGQVIGLPENAVDTRSILDGVRRGGSGSPSRAPSSCPRLHWARPAAGIGERLLVPDGTEVVASATVSGAPGCAVRLVTTRTRPRSPRCRPQAPEPWNGRRAPQTSACPGRDPPARPGTGLREYHCR